MFFIQQYKYTESSEVHGSFQVCCVCVPGYALDPSVDSSSQITTNTYIGAIDEAEKNKGEVHIILSFFSLPTNV